MTCILETLHRRVPDRHQSVRNEDPAASLHLVKRRDYLDDLDPLREAYRDSEALFAKLQAFRSSLDTDASVREPSVEYDDEVPF